MSYGKRDRLLRSVEPMAALLLPLIWLLAASVQSAPAQSAQSGSNVERAQSEAGNDGTSPAPGAEATTDTRNLSPAAEEYSGDVKYLEGPGGKLIPVPADVTWRDYVEWRRNRDGKQKSESASPAYSVWSVELDGSADGDRAKLTATVKVQLNREDEWAEVPLYFNEAVLLDTEYEGDGEASFGGNNADTGYRWWFKGKGRHQLTLSLSVPVQKRVPKRRLQLRIPPTAAVTLLTLDVPLQRVSVNAAERSAVSTRSAGESTTRTEIEVAGLGSRVDLEWQPLPDMQQAATVLQTSTSLTVELNDESALVKARQTVQALQGSFSTVTVRLPAEFQLLDVGGKQYSSHEVDPEDSNRVTVSLTEPTTGPVELEWTLEHPSPFEKKSFVIDGFEVDQARRQTGEISISVVEGYRAVKQDGEGRYVHRINARELSAVAYRFLRQPFRLVLELQKIEPYFTAKPELQLKFSEDRAELDGLIRFNVHRGALQAVELHWPGRQQESWVIEPLKFPGSIEIPEDDPETLRIRFLERKTGIFELPFKARRPIETDSEAFDLSLPNIRASSRLPSSLLVSTAANVETDLIPRGGTQLRADRFGSEEDAEYLVDSSTHRFAVVAVVHEQAIQTEAEITARLAQDKVQVTQQIIYEVSYEHLSRVKLMVPQSQRNRVKFFDEDGALLTPSWTGVEDGTRTEARLLLDESRIGRFTVTADFDLEMPAGENGASLMLPLIHSSDTGFSSVRFRPASDNGLQVSVADESWEKRLPMDGTAEWTTEKNPETVPLRIERFSTALTPDYTIDKALIRTSIDLDGTVRSRAQYRIRGPVSALQFVFPEAIEPEAFWWGDRRIETVRPLGDSGRHQLELPEGSDNTSHLLTIEFHSTNTAGLGWSHLHRLACPHPADDVWVQQMVWQVVLPYDQHLFTVPDGFTPQFHWQRQIVFWGRVPRPQYADLDGWITAEAGPDERIELAGNGYTFSRFGPGTALRFRSMRREFLFLVGAGVALALGLLLVKIPATRNVLTVLVLAFALTVAALWFVAPILVLLQPAAVGLLFAVAAALIESAVKRRQPAAPVITFASTGEAPAASMLPRERNSAAGIGSEDATAIRAASSPAPHAVSSSQSHSDNAE